MMRVTYRVMETKNPTQPNLVLRLGAITACFHTGCEGKTIYLKPLGNYKIECNGLLVGCISIQSERQQIDIKKAQLIR